ncbi:PBECR2 nuclease fold domain-containing protein [Mediterraneibacter glycyrrhizinilyticus]|uniref:PBECR2 nuclease fold domain-containing protein n=1 Tax=Mediterraneibacter glycyrrhizinilyticus TaxID=342942 RepID=UPI0025AB2E03|nr:PBECR2 nuclease fold domain-containing protein [Mediterraneibacter glycyrrhizinilyticus]MDN0043966.1 PBECR2 nuclease fold domain-containing protein [Mediterraneibacter glycyrrhizinilyticus]
MHVIGKIDREIYRCISGNIVADEVIITDVQIKHIKERHPNDYEQFSKYFAEIIAEPDYILEANRPNTAFVLKKIEIEKMHFQLILRLKTSLDPQNYKNSIITFLKIDQRKWEKYLRNKKILYSRESD